METKKCSKCKKELPITEFYKDKYRPDGHVSSCKMCHKKWAKENREVIKIRHQNYYLKNKQKINKRNNEWNNANKEHRKIYHADLYKKNKKRHNKLSKIYYKKQKKELPKQLQNYRKKADEKAINNLTDRYIKQIVRKQSHKELKFNEISNTLIKTKRLVIKIKREINNNK